jgi:hypothetical protein
MRSRIIIAAVTAAAFALSAGNASATGSPTFDLGVHRQGRRAPPLPF